MYKKVIGCIVFVILLAMSLKITSYLLRPHNTDQCMSNIEAFHSMPEDAIDCIIIGSSASWRGVNVLEMYRQFGIGAYNYSNNWLHLNTVELYLRDALKTQKPKVILLETTRIGDLLYDTDMDGEIYCTSRLNNSKEKIDYLRNVFGGNINRYISYYFPLYQFHNNTETFGIDNFIQYYEPYDFQMTMGYFYTPYGDEVREIHISDPTQVEQYELPYESIQILDRISNICNENDIFLILFTNPQSIIPNVYHDALLKYASERECVYIDMFYEMKNAGIDERVDFNDEAHLNNSGAIKVASFLGKYIVDHVQMDDMRVYDNNLWDGKYGFKTGGKYLKWH